MIGQFLEAIDQNSAIVGSTTGSNYYVRYAVSRIHSYSGGVKLRLFFNRIIFRILSTIDRELLKPSASVALHKHSNALVDVLPPEADSSITMLSADEKVLLK